MREIKFRAWDKEGGEMFFPETENNSETFFTGFKDGVLVCEDENGESYPVMQYTGLKDRLEQEIYENDLLKCDDGKVREVVWYKLGAGWRVGTDDKDTYFNGLGVYSNKLEVIGNIYSG